MANGSSAQYILAEEELSCPICFEDYEQFDCKRQPKLLLCLHTFCFECIETLRKPRGHIQCSICRTDHDVKDLSELLDNYIVFDYLVRKQLLEDEQLANQLNEENGLIIGDEELPVNEEEESSHSPEFADALDSSDKQEFSSITDQENSLIEEQCSEESFIEEIEPEIADNDQIIEDTLDELVNSESDSLDEILSNEEVNASTDGMTDEESETEAFNSPVQSGSFSENELNDITTEIEVVHSSNEEEEVLDSSALTDVEFDFSKDETSQSDNYECESDDCINNSLPNAVQLDEYSEDDEDESYTSFEVRRLRIFQRKIRENIHLSPSQQSEPCTFQ